MNVFVDDSYVELVHRLALGIEPIDAVRGTLAPRHVDATFEDQTPPRTVERHESGRLAIRLDETLESPVAIRFDDPKRRYVPRRIAFPFVELADVLTAEQTEIDVPVEVRTRRPALYPGAAYDVLSTATGIRGRARYPNGDIAPWTRIEAIATDFDDVLGGRGQGDDRGEFLLILGPIAGDVGDLSIDVAVNVTVRGAPPPAAADPPLETVNPGDIVDAVSAGIHVPTAYTRSAQRSLTLPLGRITSVRQPFVLT
jgi:hypothetical protein